MEVVNSQIAGPFQKRITFLGRITNPISGHPIRVGTGSLVMWSFLWKNKRQQQRTLGTRCHGNPDVRTWMWINVLLIEWMVLFGHYLGFFSVGCWCLDFFFTKNMGRGGKMWGRCNEEGGFFGRMLFLFFWFLAVAPLIQNVLPPCSKMAEGFCDFQEKRWTWHWGIHCCPWQ